MRLFRTEEAARKAGVLRGRGDYERVRDQCVILTPRERALLAALETLAAGVADKLTGVPETVDGYSEAKALIKSLNVEG